MRLFKYCNMYICNFSVIKTVIFHDLANQFWIFPEKITNFILFWGNSSDGMLSPTWHSSLWEKSQNLMFWNSFSIHQSHGVRLATIIIFYFSASHCNQQRRKDFISALFYIANSMIEKMYCWNDLCYYKNIKTPI